MVLVAPAAATTIVRTVRRNVAPAAATPAIARTIPTATVATTILRNAAPAYPTIVRLTTTAATAATHSPTTGIVVLHSLPMATATAETLSRAAILLRQLLLVPTPLRRAPTPRLAAAAMAVVAGLQGAQVAAAAFRVVLVGEAARVVVEVAAVTAAVVGAATAVAATDQRITDGFEKLHLQTSPLSWRALVSFLCSPRRNSFFDFGLYRVATRYSVG